ncbi:hypothetical protein PSTG_14018 [Puccinia striiformis f. sp. tritici PST-78]|uniref:DDE Tnp4 domain-containing protein n=1 Tax=Puccinia striiformis f. sp. tritici PST-78 TaxID=1165861 RepID=A0A0L0V0Q5_9BASI|nr:hypothetical protein PSTG_14018 [Puccinia striiformis f. sp. tritici PST-78]
MPRQMERGSTIARMQHIIHQHVQGAMIGSALNDNSGDSSEDSDLEEALVALIMIKRRRYLAPRIRLSRAPDNTEYLFSLDDGRFKQEFRIGSSSISKQLECTPETSLRAANGHPQEDGDVQQWLFGWHPSIDPQDYYSRKGYHCLGALVVCEEFKRITYYMTGWPGCCHDTHLWENSETNVVPAFKRPPHAPMPCPKKRFNHHLSSLRVVNKHCIGLLKGRFQSLQGLCKDLSSAGTMEKITHWISACVILHNFLMLDKSPDYYKGNIDNEDLNTHDAARQDHSTQGSLLRDQVFAEVLEYLDS